MTIELEGPIDGGMAFPGRIPIGEAAPDDRPWWRK
jgi:hypothetical protein